MAISKIESAGLGAGTVLQVVQGSTTSNTSTTSTSFVASSLSATITPKFSTSKILAVVSSTATQVTQNKNSTYTIYRNGTNLGGGATTGLSYYEIGAAPYQWIPMTMSYLDSPATTSAATYTVYLKVASGGTAYVNIGDISNTITLMEIAA